jgi:myosin heavy subunit
MDHVHIVQTNIFVQMKNVIPVSINLLHHILESIVGVRKMRKILAKSSKVLRPHVFSIAMNAKPNLVQKHTMS